MLYVFARVAMKAPLTPDVWLISYFNAWDAEHVLNNSSAFLCLGSPLLAMQDCVKEKVAQEQGHTHPKAEKTILRRQWSRLKKQQRKQARSPEITDRGFSSDLWCCLVIFWLICAEKVTIRTVFLRVVWILVVSPPHIAWDSFSGHAVVNDLMFYHCSFYGKSHDTCSDIPTVARVIADPFHSHLANASCSRWQSQLYLYQELSRYISWFYWRPINTQGIQRLL